PTGVDPVANPRTVGRPAELFCRMRLSIMRATCREAPWLDGKTKVGIFVPGTYREDVSVLFMDFMTNILRNDESCRRLIYAYNDGRNENQGTANHSPLTTHHCTMMKFPWLRK